MPNLFNIPAYFICFRETLEVAVVISSLLLLVNAALDGDRKMIRSIKMYMLLGVIVGLIFTAIIATVILLLIEKSGPEIWGRKTSLWEGTLSLVGALILTIFGIGTLKMKDSSRHDSKFVGALSKVLKSSSSSKYLPIFMLPFITIAREGVETIIFIIGQAGTAKDDWISLPLPSILGIGSGVLVGVLLLFVGNRVNHVKIMKVLTVILLVLASSLVAKGIWSYENYVWSKYLSPDGDEGPGIQYDLSKVSFALDCCDPRSRESLWGVLQAFIGWNNASYISVHLGYFAYWVIIVAYVWKMNKGTTKKVAGTNGKLIANGGDGREEKIGDEDPTKVSKVVGY